MASELLILTTGGTFDKRYPEGQWVKEFAFPDAYESAVNDILRRARMAPDSYSQAWVFAEDSTDITDTMTRRIDPKTGLMSDQPNTAAVIAARNLDKTIVLTGAAQPAVMRDSDTDFNLGLAIGAALTAAPGVYVAMNGLVCEWSRCVKDVDGRFRKR